MERNNIQKIEFPKTLLELIEFSQDINLDEISSRPITRQLLDQTIEMTHYNENKELIDIILKGERIIIDQLIQNPEVPTWNGFNTPLATNILNYIYNFEKDVLQRLTSENSLSKFQAVNSMDNNSTKNFFISYLLTEIRTTLPKEQILALSNKLPEITELNVEIISKLIIRLILTPNTNLIEYHSKIIKNDLESIRQEQQKLDFMKLLKSSLLLKLQTNTNSERQNIIHFTHLTNEQQSRYLKAYLNNEYITKNEVTQMPIIAARHIEQQREITEHFSPYFSEILAILIYTTDKIDFSYYKSITSHFSRLRESKQQNYLDITRYNEQIRNSYSIQAQQLITKILTHITLTNYHIQAQNLSRTAALTRTIFRTQAAKSSYDEAKKHIKKILERLLLPPSEITTHQILDENNIPNFEQLEYILRMNKTSLQNLNKEESIPQIAQILLRNLSTIRALNQELNPGNTIKFLKHMELTLTNSQNFSGGLSLANSNGGELSLHSGASHGDITQDN